MVADDIIEYYLQNYQSTIGRISLSSLCSSIIESWLCIDVNKKVIIFGQIHNHPNHPSGKRLKTSPIQGCFSKNGHIYVNTKNSMYELGLPHQDFAGDSKLFLENDQELEWEKLTHWTE